MGETMMRLRSVSDRSWSGVKRIGMGVENNEGLNIL
jgi:hypothetical protein